MPEPVTDNLQQSMQSLSEHYNRLVREHGYAPESVHFSSWETIERRFEILLEGFPDHRTSRILDFGCGIGHLLGYLQRHGFNGEYVGYDIAKGMIDLARSRYPDTRFEHRNLLQSPPEESFDMAFVSGVFNNATDCNRQFMEQSLRTLFNVVTRGVAFNALSRYVHYRDEGLHYCCPMEVFEFCKQELTPRVALRHDYELKPNVIPFEFTIYLYKSANEPVTGIQG